MTLFRSLLLAGLCAGAAPALAELTQDRFVGVILQTRDKLGEALDAAAVDAALGERRSAQCSLTLDQGLEAKAWSGVVESVTPRDGGFELSVAFAEGAYVVTGESSGSDPPGDMIRSPRYLFVFTEVEKL